MSAVFGKFLRNVFATKRMKVFYANQIDPLLKPLPMFCMLTGSIALYYIKKSNDYVDLLHSHLCKPRSSEIRFIKFASATYNGQVYMTPADFLESILEIHPKRRHRKRKLSENDLREIRKHTPSVSNSHPAFFRSLHRKGIISYTEFLFLLSALIKSQSKFKIAFDMIDTNGNEFIEKDEYLILEKIFSQSWKSRRGLDAESELTDEKLVDDEFGLQKQQVVDTTLCYHFFGPNGDDDLSYDDFEQFSLNLQREVLEVEFMQFSHGADTIAHTDFAKVILRYTYMDTEEYDDFIDAINARLEQLDSPGISFNELQMFANFLNNLSDFQLTMRLHIQMEIPIMKKEFNQIVKICTGKPFTDNLVDTIFAIFDKTGDGLLSYREFMYVMKDRLHRGFRRQVQLDGWQEFGMCVKRELSTKPEQQGIQ